MRVSSRDGGRSRWQALQVVDVGEVEMAMCKAAAYLVLCRGRGEVVEAWFRR